MKYIHSSSLFFLFLIFLFINFSNEALLKHKQNPVKNYSKARIKEQNNKKKTSKRKLEEQVFRPLKIYLDLAEFNYTFPKESDLDINEFITAMYSAQDILQDFLEIDTPAHEFHDLGDDNENTNYETYYQDNYGISKYTSIFATDKIYFNEYNFYIFAKFTNLHEKSTSVILEYHGGNPIIGIVLFDNNIENLDKSKLTFDYLNSLMLHHFIRLIGFSVPDQFNQFDYIPYENDAYYLSLDEVGYEFPNVINYARKYFNCSSIDRIELYLEKILDETGEVCLYGENNIKMVDLYWPKRLFLGELLTKFDYPEERILSGFTLAFLDDLPYLKVTKNYTGGLMKFGKHKGCEFFFNDCGNSSNPLYTFANEFYLPNETENSDPSCSSGRLSKTIYKLDPVEDETDIFEYYLGNPKKAGPKSTNYCPIARYDYDSNIPIYNYRCSNADSIDRDLQRDETFGNDSFCVLSSLSKVENDKDVKALCYKMICSSQSLTIQIGNYYIVCPREGGKIEAKNLDGFLLCPDYNLICSSSVFCNDLFNCIQNQSYELEESFIYDYEIKTTQNSTIYNSDKRSYGWELTHEGSCPFECMQCTSNSDCIRCRPHYDYINNECIKVMPLCDKFEDEEHNVCIKCVNDYFLVEKSDGTRYCESIPVSDQYYKYSNIDGVPLYKKCEIENCNKCVDFSSPVKCQSCSDPFKKVDDGEFCDDLSTQLFYEDSSGIYKTCKNYPYYDKCYKCQKSGDVFECLECTSIGDYILSYLNSPPSCVLRSSVDDTMYTTDNKKYYPCNNALYNDIPNCEKCDNKEQCKQCSSSYTINGTSSCILTSDINDHKYYKNPQNNFYYKCPNECTTCESETKCFGCNSPYLLTEDYTCIDPSLFTQKLYYYNNTIEKYSKCTNIPNCYKCESGTECIFCQGDYKLVLGDDSQITCQTINTAQYYETNTGTKTYYSKCSIINKCDECSSNNYCTKCLPNYGIVDNDHTKCEDISGEKYYYDTELETYKLCSNKMTNCEKCSANEDFICKNCFNTYSFKHDNNIECEVKTSLQNDPKFFTNDTGINYYSCAKFSEVENCDECPSEEICHKCKSGFDLYNNGTLCVQKSDIDNNIYIWTPNGLLSPCSSLIKDCHKCNETSKCYECQEDSALIDNDTCLKKTELEEKKNYFKDETTNRYISCSIMDNCNTCESRTECTSCLDGFILSNNLCNKINNDNNDDDGLGTGAIIGIVFGVVGFLLLAILTGYYLIKKVFNKNNGKQVNTNANNAVNDDAINIEGNERVEIVKDEKNVETEKVDVQNKKRSIHNA